MNHKALNHTIAKVIRVERDPYTDKIYLVFEIVDESFKKRVKEDWMQDIDVKIIGKNLIEDL
jgi:hypothetical protein